MKSIIASMKKMKMKKMKKMKKKYRRRATEVPFTREG